MIAKTTKRKVEVFSAGCVLCAETVSLVERLGCPSCHIDVLNMNDAGVVERARFLGVTRVPAVAIDGKIVSCCAGGGVIESDLRAAGLGRE